MKRILIFLYCLLHLSSLAQTDSLLSKCGLDNEPLLNIHEAQFINELFQVNSNFDFTDKKVVFVAGSKAAFIGNKGGFFELAKTEPNTFEIALEMTEVILLSKEEQNELGEYDAIIVFWTKSIPRKEKIMKKLKKHVTQSSRRLRP